MAIFFQHYNSASQLLLLLMSHYVIVESAVCEGTIIFYWREIGDARTQKERNWGQLDKEIEGSQGRLAKFFEPKNAYAYKLTGNCCWEVYAENFFKGKVIQLESRFSGFPANFIANSLKNIPC